MTTTTYDADTLYALLPATIRARDLEGGQPLYGLLAVVAEQINVLEDNLAQSYADLFIETCSAWVVPYIGDLVGTTPLFDSSRVTVDSSAAVYAGLTGPSFVMVQTLRSRADVGRTIKYRRTKATRPMLEELAFDVTGWPALAAEMFQRLRWTQCVRNHLRPSSFGTPDLRNPNALDCLDGAFDTATHGVDVRTPTSSQGWYQVPNVAFFLWRLASFPVYQVSARPMSAGDWRYHFSPLGNPAPLFAQFPPPPQATASGATPGWTPGSASPPLESELPAPIRRMALAADLSAYDALPAAQRPGYSTYYGAIGGAPGETTASSAAAFTIVCDGVMVPPEEIVAVYLDSWCQPPGKVVGVDPVKGRLVFGQGYTPLPKAVDVYYQEGFSAPIGGGQYERGPFVVPTPAGAPPAFVVDSSGTTPGSSTTLGAALSAWSTAGKPAAVISIVDSRTYAESVAVTLPAGGNLTIQGNDGQRPHLQLASPLTVTGDDGASLTLSGLLVEGSVDVTGPLGTLRLLHTTLVPGNSLSSDTGLPATTQPSITVAGSAGGNTINTNLTVCMSSSITGPLAMPPTIVSLYVTDSIVDGVGAGAIGPSDPSQSAGPPTTIIRSTVLGAANVFQLVSASESIFTGLVTVEQRQVGCCRFSYVPPGSSAPRRYRCQPDLEIASELAAAQAAQQSPLTNAQSNAIRGAVGVWLVPSFTSTRYGDPGYAQLAASGVPQIFTGAEDGSEMGVFCQLKQPQRAQNLVTRLGEYLPLGLVGALVYVT
jgi:hypothetical protein